MLRITAAALVAAISFALPAAACVSSGTCNGLPGWAANEFAQSDNFATERALTERYDAARAAHGRASINLQRHLDSLPYGPPTPAQSARTKQLTALKNQAARRLNDAHNLLLGSKSAAATRNLTPKQRVAFNAGFYSADDPRCTGGCTISEINRWNS
jgi:hypothetical protein